MFIARRPLEHLPIDDDDPCASLSANILRNIIFRYANTVNDLRQAVLDLHSWTLAPRLLIIDSLQEFFVDYEICAISATTGFTEFCKAHCMITAAIQNAVDSMSFRLDGMCASIISIDSVAVSSLQQYYERFQTKYFDLYYFDATNRYHACENDLNALQQKLLKMLNN